MNQQHQYQFIVLMGSNSSQTVEIKVKQNGNQQYQQIFLFPIYIYLEPISHLIVCSNKKFRNDNLCKIQRQETDGAVIRIIKNTANNIKLWKQIYENQTQEIMEGDSFKIGKITFLVKEFRISYNKKNIYSKQNEEFNPLKSRQLQSQILNSSMDKLTVHRSQISVQSIESSCRFCFDTFSSSQNPLLNVCKCSGSVKNIHLQCLRNWVRIRFKKVQTNFSIYYEYQPLQCQICKQPFSNTIVHNNQRFSLLKFDNIHPPYVLLEHVGQKVIQILVRLEDQKSLTIGRAKSNQIILDHGSICLSHAEIRYTNKQLVLTSLSSVHGVYQQLRHDFYLDRLKKLQLQIQSSHLIINPRINSNLFDDCCSINGKAIHWTVKEV